MRLFRIPNFQTAGTPGPKAGKKPMLGGLLVVAILASSSAQAGAPVNGGPTMRRGDRESGPINGNVASGQKVAQAQCVACHGPTGNNSNPQFPKLAGQRSSYLYAQLRAFKSGLRKSDPMQALAANLSNADMVNVASYYSGQRRQPDVAQHGRLAALGERVFQTGMPSCAMCHNGGSWHGERGEMMGPGMMGDGMMMGPGMMGGQMDAVPNLNGQHATYLSDQLDRFARGDRQGTVMNRLASALSPAQRQAVAVYLASKR